MKACDVICSWSSMSSMDSFHTPLPDADSCPSARPTIGIVMRGFRRPDYDIWLSATEAARAAHMNVVTFVGEALKSPVGFEEQANAIYDLISAERLDGILLLTSGLGLYVGLEGMQTFCRQLEGLPIVSLQMRMPGVPSLLVDSYRGMREVVDHLIEGHGYRRIAFLRGPLTHRGARERYRAYVEALEDHGLPLDPSLVTPPSESWDNRVAIGRFLAGFGGALLQRVDAIVGTSSNLAHQALDWLHTHGYHVPEQIALTGFDNFPHLAGLIPSMTTTHVPFDEVGRQAVDLLLRQMRGDSVPLELDVPARLVIRESCGCQSGMVARASVFDGLVPRFSADPDRSAVSIGDVGAALLARRDAVVSDMIAAIGSRDGSVELLPDARASETWASELFDCLVGDLTQDGSAQFLVCLRRTLQTLLRDGRNIDAFHDVLSVLRRAALAHGMEMLSTASMEAMPSPARVEDLIAQGRVVVGQILQSAAAASQFDLGRQAGILFRTGHTLTTVIDIDELGETLENELPKLGIERCYVALFEEPDDQAGWAKLCVGSDTHGKILLPPDGLRYWAQDLLPPNILTDLEREEPYNLIAASLYVRAEQFGFVVFGVGPRAIVFEDQPPESTVYDLLRSYISDALFGILLYDEAVRARQRAEEADRLKSRFLSTVSHELRTPLNVIVSVSEMLLWKERGDQEEMTRIHASAQHLDGLIRDVLDLASSQVGQLRLVREPLDLHQALEVVTLIGQQMASDKGLSWSAEIPDQLPRVWGDRTRLRQVALNLISNAFRFTSQGEVRFEIELVDGQGGVTAGETERGYLRVSVKDTGIGVPVEEQETIFDEFRQSERTAARGYGGLGLGLAISRRLVEMHGGMISVESLGIEGEGATFFFTVPVMGSERSELSASSQSSVSSESESRPVLILSDRREEAYGLSSYLRERGYVVQEIRVGEGETAEGPGSWLSKVLERAPRAVILGMRPAAEQGWAMMRVLKNNPATWQTPVLFYSLLQEEDSGAMMALDYLTKPVSSAGLVQVLERQGLVAAAADEAPASATILVVDDDPEILATHIWLLQSQYAGSRILQAGNGQEALDIMAQVRPDIVLLDLMMPEMTGFEVIAHMQSHPDLCNIPIVVLTAKTLTAEALTELNQGVTAVLGKGLFSAEETLYRLEAALRRDVGSSVETRKLVRRAMAYIHEHYMESISRKEIAAHVNLSPRHLDRCFSDETGVTPMIYLSRFRLRQARRLLQTTALSISEIAAAVGFSDASYFCRVFRRDLDMSPTDYRRRHA